jgi:hypothetical protein
MCTAINKLKLTEKYLFDKVPKIAKTKCEAKTLILNIWALGITKVINT